MNKSVTIVNHEVEVKEYKGQRIVTFKDIDEVHERLSGTADRNFRENKERFIEGIDYFKLAKNQNHEIRGLEIPNRGVTIITESGYLMLVKSFTDDLAWEVQRQLVNTYFNKEEAKVNTSEIDRLKIQVQGDRAQAMLINAKCRLYKELTKSIENKNLSPVAVELFGITALEEVTGKTIDYRPPCDKTYSATEVGGIVGCTSNRIGKLANANGLKTPKYGIEVLDKARGHNKEVPNFRYYATAIPKFRELLGG